MRNSDGTLSQIRWEQAGSIYQTLLGKFDTAEKVINNSLFKNRGGIGIAVRENINIESLEKLNNLSNNFTEYRSTLKRCIIENR